jgi:5'-deoxynucleotidase YfbR-like HD superfamily hydrolase
MSGPASTSLHVVPPLPYREGKTATWRGGLYNLVDPRPADVNLNEICETLARLDRFNALSRGRWTVAQHTLLCLRIARDLGAEPAADAYLALHDCHEAFIGDQTAPQQYAFDIVLKQLYPALPTDAFRHARETLAQRWDNAIYTAFRLPAPETLIVATVHKIDRLALVFEAATLFDRPQALGIDEAEAAGHRPEATRMINAIATAWPEHSAVADKLAREIRRLI